MKQTFLFFITCMISTTVIVGQAVSINNDGSPAHVSAMLDVQSDSRGVLFPRMSEGMRLAIPAPAKGLMVWDTTFNSLWGYDGMQWRELSSLWSRNGVQIENVNSGNIGIGGSSSAASLYIKKPSPSILLYDDDTGSTSGSLRGDSIDLKIHAARFLYPVFDNTPGNLILQANEDAGILGTYVTGNVGIGTQSPAYKLTLNGSMAFYSGSSFLGRIYGESGDMVVNAKWGSILGTSPAHIIMQYTYGGLFAISGNVGIGVAVPTAKLHVGSTVMIGSGEPALGYALSVNGKIMAEEMKIQDQAAWPDYVFDESYVLTPLDELSECIRAQRHLPGIPSAAEVENEGLLVGDMQRRQMEKIEELTLYILQLHERLAVFESKSKNKKKSRI